MISDCHDITDIGIIKIAEKLVGLNKLDLSCCNITDTSVIKISENLTNIQDLNLFNCYDCGVCAIVGCNLIFLLSHHFLKSP